MLGMRAESRMSVNRNLSMIPSKIQILLFPDTSPNMHFGWMLGLRLRLWALPLSSTAKPSVILQLHSTLVSPQNIFKVVISILVSPLQPLLLIDVSDQLAVRTTTKCPPQRCPASQDCSQRYIDSIVEQHSVKLCGCCFIVKLHLLVYKLLYCGNNLRQPSGSRSSCYGLCLLVNFWELCNSSP